MMQPFADAPNDIGLLVTPPESLYAWTSGADKAGLHVMVHAIGDQANRTMLDIYEREGLQLDGLQVLARFHDEIMDQFGVVRQVERWRALLLPARPR